MLESLGALYTRGVSIDWLGFDRDYARRKLELPAYPFERQRYALPKASPRGRGAAGPLRPLVDSAVQSPVIDVTILTTRLTTAAYPYLVDHRIFGEIVAPAASYIAMLLNGAASLGRQQLSPGGRLLHCAAGLVRSGGANLAGDYRSPTATFQMISFESEAGADDTIKHVTGRVTGGSGVEILDQPLPAGAARRIAGAMYPPDRFELAGGGHRGHRIRSQFPLDRRGLVERRLRNARPFAPAGDDRGHRPILVPPGAVGRLLPGGRGDARR